MCTDYVLLLKNDQFICNGYRLSNGESTSFKTNHKLNANEFGKSFVMQTMNNK